MDAKPSPVEVPNSDAKPSPAKVLVPAAESNSDKVPISEAVRKIRENSWLLDNKVILTRIELEPGVEGGRVSWRLEDCGPSPPETTETVAAAPRGPLINRDGNAGTWHLGRGISLLIQRLDARSRPTTRYHATLEYMQAQSPSFELPVPHLHLERGDCYYLLYSHVCGTTVDEVWPTRLDRRLGNTPFHNERTEAIGNRLHEVLEEMEGWTKRRKVCGADGKVHPDWWLVGEDQTTSHHVIEANLRQALIRIGRLPAFAPGSLGPRNIVLDDDDNFVGFADLSTAGFVPKGWIASKASINHEETELTPTEDVWIRVEDWRYTLCCYVFCPIEWMSGKFSGTWLDATWKRHCVHFDMRRAEGAARLGLMAIGRRSLWDIEKEYEAEAREAERQEAEAAKAGGQEALAEAREVERQEVEVIEVFRGGRS